MSRELSDTMLNELFKQESGDPFLALFTISHESFETLYLVNNSENIVSNGITYLAFPVNIVLPVDDGETVRQVSLTLDNVSQYLIDELRTVTDFIDVQIDMVLASNPDSVEISLGELKIKNIEYNALQIKGYLFMDDFLNTEIPSERYRPTNFNGLFK